MKLADLLESVQLLSERYYGRSGGSLGDSEKRAFKKNELEHELAHEDEWNRQQQLKKINKKADTMRFYNGVKNEIDASSSGLTKSKSGKWYFGYDKNDVSASKKIIDLDKKFGTGKDWNPK